MELIAGFETTYMPSHDRDVAETTAHHERWRGDLALVAGLGITRLRYPIRWHRVEQEQGRYDWQHTDEVLGHVRDLGLRPIVDLVHHTSYPRWISHGFADVRFRGAYLRFAERVAQRYPWIEEYTLFNEPFSTLFLAGHEAIWPPYLSGVPGFVRLIRNVLPAMSDASDLFRSELPRARHVFVDTCEHHYALDAESEPYAVMANDRRFFVTDLFLGRVDDGSTFLPHVLAAGGEDLLEVRPGRIDVLGLDYYAHCQWDFAATGGSVPASAPIALGDQIVEYWQRYQRPCLLSETNIRGCPHDRATWFRYTLEQCELAARAGVPLDGHCWFPLVDSADWGSLLYRCEGALDPVGVYSLDDRRDRVATSMSSAYQLAAAGAPAAALPAYRFCEPVRTWLAGYMAHMSHFEWSDPPAGEVHDDTPPDARFELGIAHGS